MRKNQGHPAFNNHDFVSAYQCRHATDEDWGILADKGQIKDWPDFHQTVKDCNHWTDENCREAVNRIHEFNTLADTWRRETGLMSSLEEKFLHPAYQRIIGMGKEAIPLIMQELKQRPGHWFWALKAITGENPMRPEHAGNLKRMTEDWLKWGERNGYIGIKR